MPSQKRGELLTKLEREKVLGRSNMTDKKARATNDLRVKRKLSSWLDNLTDVALILEHLPDDKTRSAISDVNIYSLLYLVERMLEIKNFYPVVGPIGNPAEWKVIIDDKTKKQAKEADVWRALQFGERLDSLNRFIGDGRESPISQALNLEKLRSMGMADRIKEDEMIGLDKLKQIGANMKSLAREDMIRRRNFKLVKLQYQ